MFHIPDVAFHASVHFAEFFGFTAEAGDLAPTCDSGFDVVANHVMANHLRIFQSVLEHVWAWSHHAHVTKKHVEELRRFVKAGFAQYVAPCCFAWVVLGGLQKVAVAVHFHASEFIEPKLFAVDAAALDAAVAAARESFVTSMDDDFNVQNALSIMYDLATTLNNHLQKDQVDKPALKRAKKLLIAWLEIFGVSFKEEQAENDDEIEKLIAQRDEARKNKDWAESDRLRDELQAKGIVIEDTPQGTRWHRA